MSRRRRAPAIGSDDKSAMALFETHSNAHAETMTTRNGSVHLRTSSDSVQAPESRHDTATTVADQTTIATIL
jgi:hypothetical protein